MYILIYFDMYGCSLSRFYHGIHFSIILLIVTIVIYLLELIYI